jgi:hypothetical protein
MLAPHSRVKKQTDPTGKCQNCLMKRAIRVLEQDYSKVTRDLANKANREETPRSDRTVQTLPQSSEGVFRRLNRCQVRELIILQN